jgi:tRNA A37 threonylcarbamoyladenosine dehydratase
MSTQFIPGGLAFPKRNAQAAAAVTAEDDETSTYKLHRRFDRMGRLVGDSGMERLFASHVLVVGLGGVGSWAAESLARSGVGTLTIVDFDLICVTNANRQLHALRGTTGKQKTAVMAERLRLINPRCEVRPEAVFYNSDSSAALLAHKPDLVIDAIDNLAAKTHLIATCRAPSIPLIVSGGASGRMDPTQIRVADLNAVVHDPFLAATRKLLRKAHDFPHADKEPWNILAVHSHEPPKTPSSSTTTTARASAACAPTAATTSTAACTATSSTAPPASSPAPSASPAPPRPSAPCSARACSR